MEKTSKGSWQRFRQAVPAFTDVVNDNGASMQSSNFLKMAANVQKKANERLERDLKEASQFKNKYEQLLDDLEGDFSEHDSYETSEEEEPKKTEVKEESKDVEQKRKPTVVIHALKNNNQKLKDEIQILQ